LVPNYLFDSSKLDLPSGHTTDNCQDRRAKPGEGLQCCVRLHTRYVCSLTHALPPPPSSLPTILFLAHSLFPLFFSSFLSSHPFLSLLLSFILTSALPFSLFPHPSLLPHRLKPPTARATCNHGAYREERPGICITYWTDCRLLNQRWMHFRLCVSTANIHELLFADDCELNATTREEMQRHMDLFAATCENFVLCINTEKMVVLHQPPPDTI
uniref:Reverse transcriptase domain-containing protein n=1 Tax=Schistocephalus solidus TaxID=70667 RepID=A0A183TGR8_SCHSO